MTAIVSAHQWHSVRAGLRAAAGRFNELAVRAAPSAMATKDWSVAATVAHLATLSRLALNVVRHTGEARPGLVEATTVDTVADLNAELLAGFTGRDVPSLLKLLCTDIEDLLTETAEMSPVAPHPWLGGSRLSTAAVIAHMMNELHIHGRDIALATRSKWVVPPEDAALFFELFMIGIVRTGYGLLVEDGKPVRPGRIAVRFFSSYSTPVTMVLTDGVVSIEDDALDIDVKLWFDPAPFNQMMFGRFTKLRMALTGRVRVWGKRPWLLAPFLAKVHMPN